MASLVKDRLVAPRQGWPYSLTLRWLIPVRGSGDRAGKGTEANEHGLPTVPLADQLSDVQLAGTTELGRPGVAEVGVVCPDHDPGALALAVEVTDQRPERLGHMTIPKVPG